MAPPAHQEIQTLLTQSAYDPAIVPKLEAYVRAQVNAVASTLVASDSPDVRYSFDANRTLVKLYQFFPHLEGELGMTVTALAAFLAMLEFPDTDFAALSCLIPERVQEMEPCTTLVRCADLLEACQFAEFWPEFRKLGIPEYGAREGETVVSEDRKLLSNAVNGTSASNRIRAIVLQTLAKTYRTAPLSVILAATDLGDAAALEAFASKIMLQVDNVADNGDESEGSSETPVVEKVEGDVVTFAASPDNTKRSRVFKEGVNYDSVAAMMAQTTARGQ